MLRTAILLALITPSLSPAAWGPRQRKISCAFALSGAVALGTAWWFQAPALTLPRLDYSLRNGTRYDQRAEGGIYVFRPALRPEVFAGNWLHHKVAVRIKAHLLTTQPELRSLEGWDQPGVRVPVEKLFFEKLQDKELAYVIVEGPFVRLASTTAISLEDLNAGRAIEVDFNRVETTGEDEGAEIAIRMAIQRGTDSDSLVILETVGGFRVYGPLFTQADSFKLGESRGEREK